MAKRNPFQSPVGIQGDSPASRRVSRRCLVLLSVFGFWALLSIFPAWKVGSMQKSVAVAFKVWASSVAGPFAFFDHGMFCQSPILMGFVAIVLLFGIFSDCCFVRSWSAGLAIVSVSFWFVVGFAITIVCV